MRPDVRLIAVDLDGTLLNDRKEIPPDFVPMVEALYPRGVRFVIASGRQYFNLAAMFERIADKLFFFSENGGLVFDGAENIFCRPLPGDILPALYHTGSAIPATTVLCGVQSAYIGSACDAAGRENTAIY